MSVKILLVCGVLTVLIGAASVILALGGWKKLKSMGGREAFKRILPLAVLMLLLAADAWGLAVMMPREKEDVTIMAVSAGETLPEDARLFVIDLTVDGIKQVKYALPSNCWMENKRGFMLELGNADLSSEEVNTLQLRIPVGTDRKLIMETGPSELACIITTGDYTGYFNGWSGSQGEFAFELPNSGMDALNRLRKWEIIWFTAFYGFFAVCTAALCALVRARHRKAAASSGPRQKNTAMEFYRFACAMLIILYHSQPTAGIKGFLSVEFFFIISGWFLMVHFDRQSAKGTPEVGEYVLGRVKRIMPFLLFMWVVTILVRFGDFRGASLLELIGGNIGELLMIQSLGFDTRSAVVYGDWFISAMIPASAVIYAMLCLNRKNFTGFIAPALGLMVLGYFCLNCGTFDQTVWFPGPGNMLTLGFWRALGEMSLGCMLYDLCGRVKNKPRSNAFRAWWSVAECAAVSLLVVIIFILRDRCEYEMMAFVVMLVLAGSIMTNNSFLTQALSGRISGYLGSLSLHMYLTHMLIMVKINELLPGMRFVPKFMLCAALSVLFSAIAKPLVDGIVTLLGRAWAAGRSRLDF